MEYKEFRNKISLLHEIKSRNGKTYKNIRVNDDYVSFQRADGDNPQNEEKINLHYLFDFYAGGVITTSAAKKYGLSGKQSPSVALIDEIISIHVPTADAMNKTKEIVGKENRKDSKKIESFLPIEDGDSEILILGTVPGPESLLKNEYYASNGNSMWKIIAALFNNGIPFESYKEKLDCLYRNHIALWDVYSSCDREGAQDSKIKNAKMNDIKEFIESHHIKLVLLNGKEAMTAFENIGMSIPHKYVVSTSNAYPKSLEEKIEEWRKAFELD